MNVYCVESSKLGLLKVFANYESAMWFLRGAVETSNGYAGKVVWLAEDGKGLANGEGAYTAVSCNLAWKQLETFTVSKQDVLKLV